MKLTELNPKFFAEPGRHGQGIGFDCPHCKLAAAAVEGPIERIEIPFSNPLDGGPVISQVPGNMARWQRTGDTYETLTIQPSIAFDAPPFCKWHGFITAGEVRSV